MLKTFIGREKELKQLEELDQFRRPCLVVIKGRRRIGKSRLATEFAKNKRLLIFSGIAPVQNVTAREQRDAFARQFSTNLNIPPLSFPDWSDAFNHLSLYLRENEPTVILFDEISWMGSKDPTFIPKLKIWWDIHLQRFTKLTLIFCGSVSTWIEKNILNSTAFFGRITLQIDLDELTLPECSQFLDSIGFKGSAYEKFKLLSITGGVPWYLEQIIPEETADANLKRLAFEKNGLFTLEFDRIFHDLFNGSGSTYRDIVHTLAEGMKNLTEIQQVLGTPASGFLSAQMDALVISGFVSRHYAWSLKTGALRKHTLHRLSDNYLRFFIKYIEPNLPKIQGKAYTQPLSHLQGWETIMGFQIENLLLKNRALLLNALDLNPLSVATDNPYIQRATVRQRGCQIDYLIQTHTKNLYLCEFKFNRRGIGSEIIEELKEKERRFSVPRGMAKVPVLFHLGEVSAAVYESRYFYRIINIADFLEIG